MTEYIYGIDVSVFQGKIDWAKAAQAGAKFAFIRCTVGSWYFDPNFMDNYNGAKSQDIKVGAYHVYAPTSGTGLVCFPEAQIDFHLSKLKDIELDFPTSLDCELSNGKDPRWLTGQVQKCLALLEAAQKNVPIIYSGTWWWNPNIIRWSGWAKYPYWHAQYINAVSPDLPPDFPDWVGWQFSADKNGRGAEFGCESPDVDIDKMKPEFFPGPTPPPPPPSEKSITITISVEGYTTGKVKLKKEI